MKNELVKMFETADFGQYDERMKATLGWIEANSAEQHEMYFKLKRYGYKIEQVMDGFMGQIGTFGNEPVCISFNWMKVEDTLVGMYYVTSNVAHYEMVKDWFKQFLPHVVVMSDSTNNHTVLHKLNVETNPEFIYIKAINDLKAQHAWQLDNLEKRLTGKWKERYENFNKQIVK